VVCNQADDEYDDEEEGEDEDEDDDDEADDAAGDVAERTLCPDGACVGVIGPDGRCKICRKEAA